MMIDFPPSYLGQEVISAASTVMVADQAEPPSRCEIRLPRWCIAGFDGRIEATDNGRYRTWALHSRLYMDDGPLLIVEDKACTGRNDTTLPQELPRRTLRDTDGKEYISVTYVIGVAEGCKLEFRIPIRGVKIDTSYERRIKVGILVCTNDTCASALGKPDQ
jgi:hypothetical protein